MALKDDLLAYYKNANLGVSASGDDLLKIDSFTGGSYTPDQAKAATLALLSDTTAVAIATYQAFTGHAPSYDGLTYLVNSTTNTTDLNDAYYSAFNQENRYINFSINLATGSGEGAATFLATYGTASYAQVVDAAYDKFIGKAAATAAGKDPAAAIAYLSSAAVISYLTAYVKQSTPYTTDAQISIAVKAALVAEVLNAAVSSGIGNFVKATNAMLADLSDGKLDAVSGNATPVDILTTYNSNAGSSFTLSVGIDSVVGTSGNDTISTSFTTATTLTALDSIDGGAGDDTLTIVDAATAANAALAIPTTVTVKNVETVNLTTTGLLGLDTTKWAGTTKVVATSASTNAGAQTVDVADTTALVATIAGNGGLTTTGGTDVTVSNGGTGGVNISGDALKSVSVTGGSSAVIDNNGEATLTTVALKSVDGTTDITSDAIATISVSGTTSGDQDVNVFNDTADGYDLTVIAGGTSDGTTDYRTTIVDQGADGLNKITVNATAKAQVGVDSGTVTAVVASGAGALDLALSAANLESLDAAAASGGVTITGLGAGVKTITTGAGADTFTVNSTVAVTVGTGAGNDVVTLGSAIAAGSTIGLGDGNDKLLSAGGSVAGNTSTKTTVIDGGAGIDTIAASLINASNGSQFVNFEILGLTASTLDASLLTGTTITGLELLAGGGTYSNLKTSQALSVTGNTAGTTTLGFTGVSGSSDAYAVTFAAKGGATSGAAVAVSAGTLVLNGIENVTVNSGSASGFTTNSVVLNDNTAKTLTLTGSQALSVGFTGGFGATPSTTAGVSLIDGSSATGAITIASITGLNVTTATTGLTINTGSGADSLTIASLGAVALTINSGSGNDSITVNSSATVNAGSGNDTVTFLGATTVATVDTGAGNDTVTLSAAGGTVATGAGTDSINAALAFGEKVTISDFGAGDSLILANKGTEVFHAGQTSIGTATTLATAIANAATAAAGDGTNGSIVWFQYGSDTYILADNTAGAYDATTDQLIKLTGLVNLSGATFNSGTNTLTYA